MDELLRAREVSASLSQVGLLHKCTLAACLICSKASERDLGRQECGITKRFLSQEQRKSMIIDWAHHTAMTSKCSNGAFPNTTSDIRAS
jgi:hypothetical protein